MDGGDLGWVAPKGEGREREPEEREVLMAATRGE